MSEIGMATAAISVDRQYAGTATRRARPGAMPSTSTSIVAENSARVSSALETMRVKRTPRQPSRQPLDRGILPASLDADVAGGLGLHDLEADHPDARRAGRKDRGSPAPSRLKPPQTGPRCGPAERLKQLDAAQGAYLGAARRSEDAHVCSLLPSSTLPPAFVAQRGAQRLADTRRSGQERPGGRAAADDLAIDAAQPPDRHQTPAPPEESWLTRSSTYQTKSTGHRRGDCEVSTGTESISSLTTTGGSMPRGRSARTRSIAVRIVDRAFCWFSPILNSTRVDEWPLSDGRWAVLHARNARNGIFGDSGDLGLDLRRGSPLCVTLTATIRKDVSGLNCLTGSARYAEIPAECEQGEEDADRNRIADRPGRDSDAHGRFSTGLTICPGMTSALPPRRTGVPGGSPSSSSTIPAPRTSRAAPARARRSPSCPPSLTDGPPS